MVPTRRHLTPLKSPGPVRIAKGTDQLRSIACNRLHGPQTEVAGRYDFAVDDPTTYAQVWRGEMVFRASKGPIYEYACHEGNYALANILAGARRQEAEAGTDAPPAKSR